MQPPPRLGTSTYTCVHTYKRAFINFLFLCTGTYSRVVINERKKKKNKYIKKKLARFHELRSRETMVMSRITRHIDCICERLRDEAEGLKVSIFEYVSVCI